MARQYQWTIRETLQAATLLLLALLLAPAGAHFFELFNKMQLSPEDYMITQRIYAGWDLFGILIAAALIATAAHTWSLRYERTAAFSLSASACILIVISQIIFWTFTYPMNALTENWTVMPADFVSARRQWEYSHAVNAIVTLMAFLAAVGSVILSRRPS